MKKIITAFLALSFCLGYVGKASAMTLLELTVAATGGTTGEEDLKIKVLDDNTRQYYWRVKESKMMVPHGTPGKIVFKYTDDTGRSGEVDLGDGNCKAEAPSGIVEYIICATAVR